MSAGRTHATAVVDAAAAVAVSASIGPLCVVGPAVVIGEATRLVASCTVLGPTRIGARNVVHPYAVLGGDPQDRSYEGDPTELVIGDDNQFREHVTVHRGTVKDRGRTRVGSGCLFMAGAHVAHDAIVGDGVTVANGTMLGGHVVLEDHVVTGGGVAIAPFVRIGEAAFVAAGAMVERDVPPFVIAAGDRARVRALNVVGLRRRGVPASSIDALDLAFKTIFRGDSPRLTAIGALPAALLDDPWVAQLVAFVGAPERRACRRRTPPDR